MKLTTLIILAFSFCIRIIGQQTLSELIDNAKEGKEELIAIYDLDVFRYYNLTDYDTELKQAVYRKTEDYQNKLTELKSIKAEMFKTLYYGKLEKAFTYSSGDYDMAKGFSSRDYDLKRKGFEIYIGTNCGIGTVSAKAPKSINLDYDCNILLKALPSKQVAESNLGQGVYSERLFLPMSEEAGLEIENDKENIDIYFFFTPTGKEKIMFKYLNSDGLWYNITQNEIKSDKVRVVVANKSSGKIYFDKTYSYQPPVTK